MADELVTIAKYDDYAQASMAKQVLDDAGIKSVVVGEQVAALYPSTDFAKIELQVVGDLVDEAMQILEAFNEATAQLLPGEEEMEEDEEEER